MHMCQSNDEHVLMHMCQSNDEHSCHCGHVIARSLADVATEIMSVLVLYCIAVVYFLFIRTGLY